MTKVSLLSPKLLLCNICPTTLTKGRSYMLYEWETFLEVENVLHVNLGTFRAVGRPDRHTDTWITITII